MREMSKMNGFNMFGNLPVNYQTVLNTNHPKAKSLVSEDAEHAKAVAEKALNLAMLSKGLLKGEELSQFIQSEFEKL
jgi:molecular chaperone HtpG